MSPLEFLRDPIFLRSKVRPETYRTLACNPTSSCPAKPLPPRVLESGLMHPAIGQLQELQSLDQLIASLQSDLAGLPKRMRDADAQLNGARTAVANAKAVHSHAAYRKKEI